jgi:hypothetical protein
LVIQWGFVYENSKGEQRLVVSVGHFGANPVVVWRTPDPNLKKGEKAHGSATLASFQRWATKMRASTPEDWSAFQQLERRRVWDTQNQRAIQRIKRSLTQT